MCEIVDARDVKESKCRFYLNIACLLQSSSFCFVRNINTKHAHTRRNRGNNKNKNKIQTDSRACDAMEYFGLCCNTLIINSIECNWKLDHFKSVLFLSLHFISFWVLSACQRRFFFIWLWISDHLYRQQFQQQRYQQQHQPQNILETKKNECSLRRSERSKYVRLLLLFLYPIFNPHYEILTCFYPLVVKWPQEHIFGTLKARESSRDGNSYGRAPATITTLILTNQQ